MGSTVVVTGATGGLGAAVVDRLVGAGWRVVAATRGQGSDLAAGVTAVPTDVTDEADVARLIEAASTGEAAVGAPLRAVVNLVGGYAQGGRVHETPVADLDAQLSLNLRTAYLVTAASLPHLVAAGGGSVVCVSSRAAVRPFAGAAGYVISKAALLSFVDVLAVEYRDDKVRANAVLPSVIDTPANRAAQPGADYSRWVRPEEIAELITFLCSDGAAAISGAHIPVYGRG